MADFTLDIQTWAGMSFNATHYYGTLRSPDGKKLGKYGMELTYVLTKTQAVRMNKKYRMCYDDKTYELFKVKPGDESRCFESEGEVIARAIKVFLQYAKKNDRLVGYHDRTLIYITKGETK